MPDLTKVIYGRSKKPPKCADAGADPAFGELGPQLLERDIRRLLQHPQDQLGMRLNPS
jgi:hypothetical protein